MNAPVSRADLSRDSLAVLTNEEVELQTNRTKEQCRTMKQFAHRENQYLQQSSK